MAARQLIPVFGSELPQQFDLADGIHLFEQCRNAEVAPAIEVTPRQFERQGQSTHALDQGIGIPAKLPRARAQQPSLLSAAGKRLLTRINAPEPVWMEVIGVVAQRRESTIHVTPATRD